ncbi:MAG: hypothetical protein WA734_18220 [Candidatus Acidiferrales bacterium]
MIRITAKGLAKYMTSGDASKRKILHDFKFPDPEGAVQAKYYAEARRAIEQYHGGGNDASIIVSAVDELNTKAARELGRKHDRLRNNIRALESYLTNFGKKSLTILPTPDVKFTHGQVLVSAYPDLYVKDGDRHKIIKLDLGKDHPKPEMIRIVLQVTYAAAQAANLPVLPKDVIYVEVEHGTQHSGVAKRSRLQKDIEAACQTIEDVWPRL